MLFSVLGFCTDMVLTALMQHCVSLGEELSAQLSSSLCMCLELGYRVACWGMIPGKPNLGMRASYKILNNKMLTEGPDMPGIF